MKSLSVNRYVNAQGVYNLPEFQHTVLCSLLSISITQFMEILCMTKEPNFQNIEACIITGPSISKSLYIKAQCFKDLDFNILSSTVFYYVHLLVSLFRKSPAKPF